VERPSVGRYTKESRESGHTKEALMGGQRRMEKALS